MLANSSKSIVNEELSEFYNSKCVETIHQQPKPKGMVKKQSRLQHYQVAKEIITQSSKKIPRQKYYTGSNPVLSTIYSGIVQLVRAVACHATSGSSNLPVTARCIKWFYSFFPQHHSFRLGYSTLSVIAYIFPDSSVGRATVC